jgi:hypothetical protein
MDSTLSSPRPQRPIMYHLHGMVARIALGILTAMLISNTAIPAFAGKLDRGRAGSHDEQKQGMRAAENRKGHKRTTVKKTFTSGEAVEIPAPGADLEIGPANPFPVTIVVGHFKKAKISDLNLTLRGFTHTFPADLDVLLAAPDGRTALLMGDVGREPDESAVTNITLTLDDEAASALPTVDTLSSGSFQPFVNGDPGLLDFPAPAPVPSGSVGLSTFDGSNPNGEW